MFLLLSMHYCRSFWPDTQYEKYNAVIGNVMKIRKGIKVRDVAGEHIIMRIGDGKKADMTTVIALNESSLFLFNKLVDKDFDIDDVVRLLTDEYNVDEAVARSDAESWVEKMETNALLEK